MENYQGSMDRNRKVKVNERFKFHHGSQVISNKFNEFFVNVGSALVNKIPHQGVVSIRKTVLPGMAIPMLKIRRPNGRLIFNMEIAIRR